MIATVVALVLLAALFHATWNALLKTSGDPMDISVLAAMSSAIVWTPIAAVAWLVSGRPGVPWAVWILASVSALLEVAYFTFLSAAYRRGSLSAVYSLARGSAPLLAVFAGLIVLRERVSGVALAGIGVLLVGMWTVRRPEPAGSATVPALLTGVAIAAYSAVDSVGVHHAPPWLYGYVLWVLTALMLFVWSRIRKTEMSEAEGRAGGFGKHRRATLIGMLMTVTFLIALIALRLAPLALVAPLRESAVVFVTLWGIWKLDERSGVWLRLTGALAIACGAALIALS